MLAQTLGNFREFASGLRGSSALARRDEETSFDDAPAPAAVRRTRVPKHEIAEMTAQLAIMTQSGLDLSSALSSLAAQCERPALAVVLNDINDLVQSGNTLSESLKLFPEVFDGAYVATVAAAEASGRMAQVLKQLAEMQRHELQLRQTIKGLLTYPLLLTLISGSVISILVVFVLPRFAEIFSQYEVALPIVTRMMLGVASEMKARWWLWLPAIGGTIFGVVAWRFSAQGRRRVDAWALNLAVVRNVTRPLFTGRICTLLGLLLQSGVPLLEGLRLCRQAVGNCVFQDLLADVCDSVLNGHGMGSALQDATIVPQSAREMLTTGERTGNLAEVARLLGSYYEQEAESRMKQVVRLSEPLITVVMGGIVAVVVLSVMLPIFDLSTAAH
jgi:type II secretory pathway component PulF